jgi:hypothetical protein
MGRKDILKKAFEAIVMEERAIFLYAGHLKVVLEWSGLTERDKRRVQEVLDALAKEIIVHESVLEALSAGIAGEGTHVH